jgi:hypothetical protein
MPRLRVLEKAGRDARRQRIGLEDDRLGVIRDDDNEDAPENSQAASHASIARAVVSSKPG